MYRSKDKPWRSKAYLANVRGEPCLSCGSPFDVQAHHLRHGEKSGMGRKVSDKFVVPLCAMCHMDCHTRGNEADWWVSKRSDPIEWALRRNSEWMERKK